MSFFVRENNISKKNKKFTSINKRKLPQKDQDEELDSETEELNGIHKTFKEYSDDEDTETPDSKRLRLAKQYLEEIKKSDDEDEDVSRKLKLEFLESIGKLKKYLADNITGYDDENIVTLKHKLISQPVTCICLTSNDNILFSGSKSGKVLKWNIEVKRQIGSIALNSHIMAIALTSDNKFLAVSDRSNKIYIFDPESLKKLHTFEGHRGVVTGIAFRRDTHQMFTCSEDRTVKVFSLDEMVYVETLFGHQNPITSIDALQKERALTSGGCDGTLRIWKIVEESQLVFNAGHFGSIDCVRFINEETFLSCGDDGTLCVWSSSKKRPISSFKLAHGISPTGVANWITSIATLVNTDLIASGSCDGFIRLWKLDKNFREIKIKFEIPVVGFVNSLQFTSNGHYLIAGMGQEHRLGRWWTIKETKNKILVIPLKRNE